MKHGGKRTGAGRKKISNPFSVRLPEYQIEYLKKFVRKSGTTQSEVIRTAIDFKINYEKGLKT